MFGLKYFELLLNKKTLTIEVSVFSLLKQKTIFL